MTVYWPYPPLNTLPGKIQKKESPIDKQAENNPNKNNKLDGLDFIIINPMKKLIQNLQVVKRELFPG